MLLTPTAPLATSLLAGLVKVRPGDGTGPVVPGLDSHGGLTLQTQDANTGATPLTIIGIASQTGALQSWQDSGGNVLGSIAATGLVTATVRDAGTNTSVTARASYHQSNGVPAANFGWQDLISLDSANNTKRPASAVNTFWSAATDGSQTANMAWQLTKSGGALATYMALTGGGPLTLTPATGSKGLVALGLTGSLANIAEFQVGGVVKGYVTPLGDLAAGPGNTLARIGVMLGAPTGLTLGAHSDTGGNLTNGAAYFWVVTSVDPLGQESVPSTEVTATTDSPGTGASAQQTLSWTGVTGAAKYNVYRTAAGGSAGGENTLAGTVFAGTLTLADTAAGGARTLPTAATARAYATAITSGTLLPNLIIAPTVGNVANYGALSIGAGPFDGTSTGKFAGSSSGTYLALNAPASGFSGDFARYQLAGADRWQVTSAGLLVQTASDAGTSTSALAQTIYHKSSGTPAANFGAGLLFQLDSANNTKRSAIQINAAWSVATDTSQTSYLAFQTVSAGGALTEALRIIPAGLNGPVTTTLTDAGTNNQPLVGAFAHRSSGTPAANFGTTLKLQADSSNNTLRDLAALVGQWTTATDASQASQLAFQLVSAGGALTTALTLTPLALTPADGLNIVLGTTTGMKIGTGTTQKLAFYNSTPVVKATVSGAKGSNAALGSLMTALAALGLVTDSTSA